MPTLEKTLKLHRAQAEFRRSDALYRAFVGGRGAGKSWVGAYDLIRRAGRGRTYLIGSPTATLLADTTFPTFQAIARELGVWGSVRITPYPTVTLANGATVRFRSADDPEKMRGPNLSGVWLDEASLMPEEAYTVCIASLREAGEQGWLSATFTPKGLTHWTFSTFGTTPPKPNTKLFHARTGDNPFLPGEFHQTLKEQYGGRLSAQELEGKFLQLEGAEWPPEYFDAHAWFADWPQDLVLKVIGVDPSKGKDAKFGDYSAITLVGLSRDGTMWADADLRRDRSAEALVAEVLEHQRVFGAHAVAWEGDLFQELFVTLCDRVAAAAGFPMPNVPVLHGGTPKPVRIRRLGPYLARRKIRFRGGSPGAKLLVDQLRDFPVGANDDGPDSLEIAVRTLVALFNGRQKRGPTRVTTT